MHTAIPAPSGCCNPAVLTGVHSGPAVLLPALGDCLEVLCLVDLDSLISRLSPPVPPSRWWLHTCACDDFMDSLLPLEVQVASAFLLVFVPSPAYHASVLAHGCLGKG